jgi:hypothetical protein
LPAETPRREPPGRAPRIPPGSVPTRPIGNAAGPRAPDIGVRGPANRWH